MLKECKAVGISIKFIPVVSAGTWSSSEKKSFDQLMFKDSSLIELLCLSARMPSFHILGDDTICG